MAIAAEALLRLKTVFDGGGLDAARRALGGLEREAKGVRGSLKDMVGSASWQGAAAAATGISAGLVYAAKKAIELETQMVQVRKVVEFDSPNGLNKLTQDLVKLSTEIPYTAKELGELAAAAGQAGYAEKDILKFVKAAAQMGTAFNMPAKEAGEAMVAFQAAMGLPLDDAIKLGDAINTLSDNMKGVVEPRALVDVVKRVGAIGVASGLSAKEVAALGAAFLAPGTNAEVAATGMKNFLKALTIGDAGSKSFKAAFGQIGLDAKQVAKDMQTNALPTIKNVLTRIAALPKELQAGVISQIFGEESKAAIMPLLTNLKLVDEAFGLVANESKFAGSMQKEFNNQLNSTEAQLKIFKNNLDAVAISLGQALLPGINAILGALRPVIGAIGFLSQKIPGFSALIVGLGVAFAGLVISAPFITSVITLAGALSRLGILATIAGWLGAVGPWLSRLAPWLLQIGSVVTRIGPLLSSIVPILLGVGRVLLGIFTGPVGWATLLATAAVAAYSFRDQLIPAFTGIGALWNTYVVAPIRAGWTALVAWFGTTMGGVGTGLGAAWQTISTFFNTYVIIPIKAMWDGFVFYVLQTIQAAAIVWWQGVAAGFQTYVVQPIQFAFTTLIAWFGQAILQLRTWFATIWAGIAQGFQIYVLLPIQQGWATFTQWFYQSTAALRQWLLGLWQGVSQGFFANVVQPIQQGWSNLMTWLGQGIQSLKALFRGMWAGIAQEFFARVVMPIQTAWQTFVQWFLANSQPLRIFLSTMWQGVGQGFYAYVVQPIQQGWTFITQWLRSTVVNVQGWFGPLWNGVATGFNLQVATPIQMIWNAVLNYVRTGWSVTTQWFFGMFSMIGRAFNTNLVVPIRTAFTGLVSGLKTLINNLFEWLRSVGNVAINKINNVRRVAGIAPIPGFARGGHVSGPTLAWVGEGGDPGGEYIIPAKKMAGASMAYLSGARGSSVIPGFAKGGYVGARSAVVKTPGFAQGGFVSSGNPMQTLIDRRVTVNQTQRVNDGPIQVTTGPILEFNGQQYVTMEDYQRGLRDVKRQTLGEIRTAAGRRATGR